METLEIPSPQTETIPISAPLVDSSSKGAKLSPQEIKKKSEQNALERELPKIPGKRVQGEDLTNWFNLLTPNTWKRITAYIYRAFPIINRKFVDPEANNYIDIMSEDTWELTGKNLVDYLRRNHGGGKYKIMINDTDTDGKNSKLIFEGYCGIPLDEAMPNLNLMEVDLQDPKNMSYVVLLQKDGILDEKKRIIGSVNKTVGNTNTPNAGATGETIGAMTHMMERFAALFSKLNEPQKQELAKGGLNELFLEKMKQESPSTMMNIMTPVITMLTTMVNKPQDNHTDRIMEMQSANHKMQMENQMQMMKMMMESNKGKESGSDDWLDKVLKLKTVFPGMFGGRNQPEGEPFPKTTTEVIADVIKELGLPLLGFGSQLLQMTKGVKPIVPVTTGQAQEMVTTVVDTSKGHNLLEEARLAEASRPKIVQMPSGNEANPNSNPNDPASDPNMSVIAMAMLQQYGGLLLNALKSGTAGEIAGEQLKNMSFMFGQDIHQLLKSQGKDKILYTMKHTEFWNLSGKVYGEEHIEEFVDRFLNFENFLDDGGQDGDDGKEGA